MILPKESKPVGVNHIFWSNYMKLLIVFLMLASFLCRGQDLLKIIVPFSPGGAPDVATRLIEVPLSKQLNQPIQVDYKVGAGGEIGHKALASADSKNMTLAMTTVSVVINNVLKTPQPYDLNNMIPVAYIQVPFVLFVSSKTNIKNLKDLQNHKGNLNYGTFGYGSATHIISEQLAKNLNKSWTQIPYKGAPQITHALLAGDIDMAILFYPQALPLMQNNQQVIPLTIDLPKRHPGWPGLPTFTEFTLKKVANTSYVILLSNLLNNTKEITRVQTAFLEILKNEDLLDKFNHNGFILDSAHVIPTSDFLLREKTRVFQLIRDLNIKD
jgi:tripartite-type tricarboxylate transporter receptor subunit TctC